MVQAAPRALELLKSLMMHDRVDLLGQLLVQARDDLLDRIEYLIANDTGVAERLLHQCRDGAVDLRRRPLAARLEALPQEVGELVWRRLGDNQRVLQWLLRVSAHDRCSASSNQDCFSDGSSA